MPILIKQNLYPFHKYKISKLRGKRIKHALKMAEIEIFKEVDCDGDVQLINAKNYFLFSFYSRGMNFADMKRLRWSDITQTASPMRGLKLKVISP